MSLLNSFRIMSPNDSSNLDRFGEILGLIEKWTPYIHKYNRQDAEDAKNQMFLNAVAKYDKKESYIEPYIIKASKHYRQSNKFDKTDLIENMEDFMSNDLKFLNKATISSLEEYVSNEELQELVDNFITLSIYKEPLEYMLLTHAKDFIYLMEDLVQKEEVKSLRSTGLSKKRAEELFEDSEFVSKLANFAFHVEGFLAVLIYYYITYKDVYHEIAKQEINYSLNDYVLQYTTTLCYILDTTVHNKSKYKKTFYINRENIIDEIFNLLFSDNGSDLLAYEIEGVMYYQLLDGQFYFESINFEEILTTQIRNYILQALEINKCKYVGEVGAYDIYVSEPFSTLFLPIQVNDKRLDVVISEI